MIRIERVVKRFWLVESSQLDLRRRRVALV